jgi:hypothetical protein
MTDAPVYSERRSLQNRINASLRINKDIFNENLSKTQAYCHWRMSDKTLDNARVFRSFNPDFKGRKLFEFQHAEYGIDPVSCFDNTIMSEWTASPFDDDTIEQLYARQMKGKSGFAKTLSTGQSAKGDIIISKIDLTQQDGASAFQSQGFFDTYDLPPIDTWFYMTEYKTSRLIFAWVPQQYKPRVNQAILVNCTDCLGWFSQWYPGESQRILSLN